MYTLELDLYELACLAKKGQVKGHVAAKAGEILRQILPQCPQCDSSATRPELDNPLLEDKVCWFCKDCGIYF